MSMLSLLSFYEVKLTEDQKSDLEFKRNFTSSFVIQFNQETLWHQTGDWQTSIWENKIGENVPGNALLLNTVQENCHRATRLPVPKGSLEGSRKGTKRHALVFFPLLPAPQRSLLRCRSGYEQCVFVKFGQPVIQVD